MRSLFPRSQSAESAEALRAVLPKEIPILPVGGHHTAKHDGLLAAGADGFGLGSALYKPGMTVAQVAKSAADFRLALNTLPKAMTAVTNVTT
jgi:2-dehydro-3-deoxyphosphogalactonate aldolase